MSSQSLVLGAHSADSTAIDSTTSIPTDLYDRLLKEGRRARGRGQHCLCNTLGKRKPHLIRRRSGSRRSSAVLPSSSSATSVSELTKSAEHLVPGRRVARESEHAETEKSQSLERPRRSSATSGSSGRPRRGSTGPARRSSASTCDRSDRPSRTQASRTTERPGARWSSSVSEKTGPSARRGSTSAQNLEKRPDARASSTTVRPLPVLLARTDSFMPVDKQSSVSTPPLPQDRHGQQTEVFPASSSCVADQSKGTALASPRARCAPTHATELAMASPAVSGVTGAQTTEQRSSPQIEYRQVRQPAERVVPSAQIHSVQSHVAHVPVGHQIHGAAHRPTQQIQTVTSTPHWHCLRRDSHQFSRDLLRSGVASTRFDRFPSSMTLVSA